MSEGSALSLDWDQVDVRGGLVTLVVIVGVAVVLVLFGTLGLTVGLAALFVMIADQPGPVGSRVIAVLTFTVAGSLLAFAGAWAGDSHLLVGSVLMAAIVYLATIAAALGKPAAVRGLLLAIWVVMALALAGSVEAPYELALAFLVGGLVAGLVVLFQGIASPPADTQSNTRPPFSSLLAQVGTPLGRFALIRGAASGLAAYLGGIVFPDFPVWAIVAVLVILQAEKEATWKIGLLRTGGTLLGVVTASLVLAVIGDSQALVITGFLLSGFAMVALQRVNYAVFTLFLTVMLILLLHITGSDALTAGVARFLATLLGAAIAFTAILIATRLRHPA